MFLTRTQFDKKSHILHIIFFMFLKHVQKQTWNSFNTIFNLREKIRKAATK